MRKLNKTSKFKTDLHIEFMDKYLNIGDLTYRDVPNNVVEKLVEHIDKLYRTKYEGFTVKTDPPTNKITKPICSECGGKKILDFGFYQRQCMKCTE